MKRTVSSTEQPLFLGLDSSTQSLKATLLDANLSVMHTQTVSFDTDLPQFKTQGGVHRHADGLTVTAPAPMWCAALDLLLDRMRDAGWPLARVVALSGSGQQHGCVWLGRGARRKLQRLDPRASLADCLADVFSMPDSPIWMDSSTRAQCVQREAAMGGAQAVAELTGSRAYERFTGNQIAKYAALDPVRYRHTERIALVSSFVAGLCIGDYAPIDAADGAGMNLMSLRSRRWAARALACTAPGLADKLGAITASHRPVGRIHPWYVERYGFNPACLVIAFSGDNPCSLAGLRLQRPGEIAISLGTSNTVFGSLSRPKPSASEGHIFVNPVERDAYMALVCYKNGSLAHEKVRDAVAGRSWKRFDELVARTQPGNNGCIGFYFFEPEITPPLLNPGVFRFDASGRAVDRFEPETEVRALLEWQFLSMRLHGGHIGLKPARILATGGASVSPAVIRVMADVFGAPVSVAEQADSASLGAAYRAVHGWECARRRRWVSFASVMKRAAPFRVAAEPDKRAHAVYGATLKRFEALEQQVVNER